MVYEDELLPMIKMLLILYNSKVVFIENVMKRGYVVLDHTAYSTECAFLL
jgi:hypothetical protein